MNDAKRPCPTLAEAVVELARHFSEDEGGHRQAWSVVVVALHEARADAVATHHALLRAEADAKASEALAYAAGAEAGRAWASTAIGELSRTGRSVVASLDAIFDGGCDTDNCAEYHPDDGADGCSDCDITLAKRARAELVAALAKAGERP